MRTATALGLIGICLGLSCATPQRPGTATTGRIKDSVPERIAAQRGANRTLQLEEDDQRWGIEAARERDADKKARRGSTVAPPPAPLNLSKPPTVSPTTTTPGAPAAPQP